jgi:hypothetical protein
VTVAGSRSKTPSWAGVGPQGRVGQREEVGQLQGLKKRKKRWAAREGWTLKEIGLHEYNSNFDSRFSVQIK